MANIVGKKLPTVEQVEIIITEWGDYSVEEFAQRFDLDKDVIEETIDSIRRLIRVSSAKDKPIMSCFRNDTIDSIVKCAGSRHGYF